MWCHSVLPEVTAVVVVLENSQTETSDSVVTLGCHHLCFAKTFGLLKQP